MPQFKSEEEYKEYRRFAFLRNSGEAIEAAGSAGFGHMAYAMFFQAMGGAEFVKAATKVMGKALDPDDGIDFFTGVLPQLDMLINTQMREHFPGIDFTPIQFER